MPLRKQLSDAALEILKGTVLDAVVAVDSHGKIVAWNLLAEKTFGWSEKEAIGRYLHDLFIPQRHRKAHGDGMARYLETGIATVVGRRIEISAVNRDGREFPVELSIVMAPEGGEATFIGFIRDITDRVQGQSRLAISEESLRLATDAAEIGTWDLDLTSNTLIWSDRTRAMFGISPAAPYSMDDFYGGLHPDDVEQTSLAFAAALDPSRREIYDVIYRTIGKEDQAVRWVAAKGKGLFNDNGECVRAVGTAIDITQSKIEEARGSILTQLNELLSSPDISVALHTACALMGEHFGVSRTGYGQLDRAEDAFKYTVCWTDGQVPPLLGAYPASAFRAHIIDRLEKGQTVVVDDLFANAKDEHSRSRDMAKEVDTRAILVVPFLRGGRLRTVVYLNSRNPRAWQADEVTFMEAVARRTQHLIDKAEAEAMIAAKDAQFSAFAQAMPNHAWMADSEGRLFWFNDQVYSYTGYRRDQLGDAEWPRVIHEDDQAAAAASWLAALESGTTYQTQYRILRADQEYRWHLVRAVPIKDLAGEILSWVGTNTDVHDQKVANEALEARVREAIADRDRTWQNSRDLLVVHGPDGVFRSANPAWSQVLGRRPEDVVGHSFLDFVWPDDAEISLAGLDMTGSQNLTSFLNRWTHLDGTPRWISWNTAREGEMVYAYGRDVTAIKAKEAELQQTQDALRQAQKMEAVGQLTGGIAHDFNNMLAVVSGSLQLLDRRVSPDDVRAKRHIASALEASRRSAKLTQRLLAFSRQQPLRPEVLNPNKLVAGMSDLFAHSLGAQVILETVLAAGIWQVHADQNELENVLLNLAVNARDAMPEGGKLTIETQNALLDDRYVGREPGVAAGQYVLLAVTDTGGGMPPEVIEKAFDPFFTTKAVGKGTGLGLSQVYGFVKQSGGHIKVYSEVGQGTTIKIYLPRHMDGRVQGEAISAGQEIDSGAQQELILVVDDELIVRQFSVDALLELGYRVLEADGAVAALAILNDRADIDLLFTDIVMPEINGRKLADAAKSLRPKMPIIYTTGYTKNAVVHNGIVDAGVELIGKPFTLEDLALKVRAVLDSAALRNQ